MTRDGVSKERSIGKAKQWAALSERLSCFSALRRSLVLPGFRSPGVLKGASLGVKDLFDLKGFPTSCGGKNPFLPQPEASAVSVERVLQAGMIPAGKTEMVELAVGGWGTNRARRTPWNPWDPDVHRVPGGSSSGSAVAVAAGLVHAALGSDTGGSVRIPAAMCGIVGLKPGWGQISQTGMVPLSPALDVIGPMAGDTETVAAMYLALLDSASTRDLVREEWERWQGRSGAKPLKGLRVAFPADEELTGTSSEVRAGFEAGLHQLSELGVSLGSIRLRRPFASYAEPTATLFLSDGFRLHQNWLLEHEDEMDPWVVRRLLSGEAITTAAYERYRSDREPSRQRFIEDWGDAEAFVLPTTPITAIPVADVDETQSTLALYTRPFNYMDLPALAVPMGLDSLGLPMSLQIIGRPGAEGTLLGLGSVFMGAASRRDMQPPLYLEGDQRSE